MEELTKYDLHMFAKIEILEFDQYYDIQIDRPDCKEFIAMVKKRIDIFDDFIFSNDYTKFKRCTPQKIVIEQIEDNDKIFKMEWYKESEVNFNWDHLPENKMKAYDKKKFNQALGRQ